MGFLKISDLVKLLRSLRTTFQVKRIVGVFDQLTIFAIGVDEC